MTKRLPKPRNKARKGAKRGPKEERLIITDPQSALDKLLAKPQPSKPKAASHDGSLDQILTKKPS
jgi:hypothetical protein